MLDRITGLLKTNIGPSPVAVSEGFTPDMIIEAEPEYNNQSTVIENKIRNAQFELEHYVRVQADAKMELASVQKSWGSPTSDFEKLAQKHYDDATRKIEYYTTILNAAEQELIGQVR